MNTLTIFAAHPPPTWPEVAVFAILVSALAFIFWHIANYPGE